MQGVVISCSLETRTSKKNNTTYECVVIKWYHEETGVLLFEQVEFVPREVKNSLEVINKLGDK